MREPAEHPDVLYDFLYKDIGRIASYYAQVFRGQLMGVEESSSDRDVHETLLKGSVAVASGEFKSVGDIQSTTRRSIDPMMSSRPISLLLSWRVDLSRKISMKPLMAHWS